MGFLKTIMGPLGHFTTPKSYEKKVAEGLDESEALLRKARRLQDSGDYDKATAVYKEVIKELDKQIFRENLPLWDMARASIAVAIFTIPIAWMGPWWTVAGVAGAITYTLVATHNVRKESKPKFVAMRQTAAEKYNLLLKREHSKITLSDPVKGTGRLPKPPEEKHKGKKNAKPKNR